LTSVFDGTERHCRADTPEGDVAIPMTDEERDVWMRAPWRGKGVAAAVARCALKIVTRGVDKETRLRRDT